MREVELDARAQAWIGAGALQRAEIEARGASPCAVLADRRVAELHRARLPLANALWIDLPPGEDAKDLINLGLVLEQLAEAALDRQSTLFAFGGGATSDLAGLAAALYMRGIRWVVCPTTLLAMVDAAIGGKTAVNLARGKNLVGAFHPARALLADPELLASLPEREWRSGLGEALKSAVLEGEDALAALERDAPRLVQREPRAVDALVARCIEFKARIVRLDPHERDARAQLNLGHTFAHAFETLLQFQHVPHGLAVAAGVGLALSASRAAGVLRDGDLPERVSRLAQILGLPRDLGELEREAGVRLHPAVVVQAMRYDKKSVAGSLRFVLVARAGEPVWGQTLEDSIVYSVLASAR